MPRRKDICNDLREAIVDAHKCGKGYKTISKQFEVQHSTVRKIIQKWKTFKTVANLPRSGRPSKFTSRSDCAKATKRKHVLGDYVQLTEQQRIVKVLGSPGNNLHEVETSDGERFLASMPTKFRKNIWIKRGDFLIVDPIAEGEKVKAEIAFILYKDHQRLLQKEGHWPSGFNSENITPETRDKESNHGAEAQAPTAAKREGEDSETDSDDDSGLFINTNHVQYEDSEDESDSEEESVGGEDEEEEK